MKARTRRELGTDVLLLGLGAAVAFLLLRYAHGAWQSWPWAVGCAVVGIVARRAVAPSYASFPGFLRRPLNVGVALVGTVLAVWGTLLGTTWTSVVANLGAAVTLPLVAASLGLAVAAGVYTHARVRREVEEHRVREAALRETALRARLRALQAQINPHFLFNAFNALAELTHDDPDKAESLITDLAHLLRYSLRSSAVGTVPLAQELEAVDRYLRVERARLGERLRVEISVEPGVEDLLVPGLILQPLVENAVQHAVAPRPEGGTVHVRVASDGDRVGIVVEDDGPGLPDGVREHLLRLAGTAPGEQGPAPSAGTGGAGGGLTNVIQRLSLGYRGAARLVLGEPGEDGFRIRIEVPR